MQSFLKSGKLGGDKSNGASSKSASRNSNKVNVPWVEKYRPKTVSDVVEQNEVIAVLKDCIQGADLPNLLLYGPPGTGKTSTILAAAHQLFGDLFRDRILELNASDERGIQVIRDKVKVFSQLTATGTRSDGKPCPSFKIIILDEADSMTHAAQAALRRTMEKEVKTTRFCLICNYVTRIIEPLTSRCAKFRFKPLNDGMIYNRLTFICKEENIKFDDETLNVLVETSGGDMRKAITSLQSCSQLSGVGELINIEDVYEVTGIVPNIWLEKLMSACSCFNYNKVKELLEEILLHAYAASSIIDQLNEIIIASDLTNKQKAIIGEKLAIVSYRLQEGGSEYVQLLDLACTIIKAHDIAS